MYTNWLIGCTVVLLLLGCERQVNNSVTLVYQGAQCGTTEPSMVWLSTEKELIEIFNKASGTSITLPQNESQVQYTDTMPKMELDKYYYIYVSSGMQPSAGYQIVASGNTFNIVKSVAQLPIELKKPQPGTMQAMMTTVPCAIIEIDKGNFKVVDAMGIQLTRIP